jgi:signal transduction histidine kinase
MTMSRVLIVDDDPALLTALSGALKLRLADITVETCDSAMSAIQRISQTEFDAVVTDIKMPGMDGLALLKEIQDIKPELPTLLITGHGQHDLAVQALRGGAFDFIQKPIDRDYVVASLTRAIRVRKLDRQIRQQQQALATHAAELEDAVEERTEQLRIANRRKDEFLATLSHELRNPLAPIRSGLELLEMEGKGDPEVLRLMHEQVLHLVRLIDDLLDTSRIMQGKISLRKEPVELCQLIEQAVKSMLPMVSEHQHELVTTLPNEPLWLLADPVRIEQIIKNLLNNAIKYTDPKGRLELKAERSDAQAVISVQDTGIGIESELLPSIFDLFTQSTRSLDRSQGGLGIGLTLVQQLVELHHGSITAHSEGPGKGSRFVVRLPIHAETAAAKPTPVVSQGSSTTSRRVLVVDDNVGAAQLMGSLLKKAGSHNVEMAHDGQSALAKMEVFTPEVVLLDIGLPGIDGYQMARRIRAIPEFRNIMLIAVTGFGQDFDRQKSKEAGFDKHLVKPVEFSHVQEILSGFPQPTC